MRIRVLEQVINSQPLTVWHVSFLRQNEENVGNHLRDECQDDARRMFHHMVAVILDLGEEFLPQLSDTTFCYHYLTLWTLDHCMYLLIL